MAHDPNALPGVRSGRGTARRTKTDSWQLGKSLTASDYIAARAILPMGTQVSVRYIAPGRSVVARIIDFGLFYRSRIVDASAKAAGSFGFQRRGPGKVRVNATIGTIIGVPSGFAMRDG